MGQKKRRKRFRVQPRFFLILLVLAAAVGLTLFLVNYLKEKKAKEEMPEPTPIPTSTPAPSATPRPSLPPDVTVVRAESANPSKFGFETELMANGKSVSSFERETPIRFGRDSEYTKLDGILTFGGNNYRNSFTFGTQNVNEKRLKEVWSKNVGAIGTWSGTGWTGQPLIVHWEGALLQCMNIAEKFKEQENGVTEVIYPAMDGNIYFFELETGGATRNPIPVGVVLKGTGCIDPAGNPVLYVGQGIPVENEKKNGAAYVRAYSLIDQSELATFGGYDYFARRVWQAYDGSPIIADDTLIYGGENGVVYTYRLNTSFDATAGTVSLDPDKPAKYQYMGSGYSKGDSIGSRWLGIESSVAAFRNYLYFTDNGGRLQCLDLNTLQLKYVTDVTDESDATVVLEESFDDRTVYLYTASQVKYRQDGCGEDEGFSFHRKIDALTGSIIWEKSVLCSTGDSSSSGGTVATPHVGRFNTNISNLVIYAVSYAKMSDLTVETSTTIISETPAEPSESGEADAETGADEAAEAMNPTELPQSVAEIPGESGVGGKLIAYDKTTGEVMWTVEQEDDYWSSPVVIYDGNGKAYVIQCDRGGFVTMYDAVNGTKLVSVDLGSRIDSTPAVYGDYLVVGTRGKGGAGKAAKISCIKIS